MKGEFTRWESSFRHWVTPDGSPGPSGDSGCAAEPGRYHLHVSYACPWAQGESLRPSCQRQSALYGSSTQVAIPRAPARWATEVSTLMTRSSWAMAAAVSP